MQICFNCHTKCPDDANYCHQCQTKLSNAKGWAPDFRKIKEASDINKDDIIKLIRVCFDDETFRERLLNTLIIEAAKGMQSGVKKNGMWEKRRS